MTTNNETETATMRKDIVEMTGQELFDGRHGPAPSWGETRNANGETLGVARVRLVARWCPEHGATVAFMASGSPVPAQYRRIGDMAQLLRWLPRVGQELFDAYRLAEDSAHATVEDLTVLSDWFWELAYLTKNPGVTP